MAVVEFHSFKDNENRFIVKELAVVSDSYCCQLVFKPPYAKDELNAKMRRTANWLERFFHKISWSDGGITYKEQTIIDIVKPFDTIYTKGVEKVKFLGRFHNNVKDITFDPVKVSNFTCILWQHRDTTRCALRSAKCYYAGLLESVE